MLVVQESTKYIFVLLNVYSVLALPSSLFARNNEDREPQQHKCPVNITPAHNRDSLVKNMIFFIQNGVNKDREFYTKNNIKCYFSGEILWEDSNIESTQEKHNKIFPYNWGMRKINKIKIINPFADSNYEIVLYYIPKRKYCREIEISLYGKDAEFNPIPVLQKKFSDIKDIGIIYIQNSQYSGPIGLPKEFNAGGVEYLNGKLNGIEFRFSKYSDGGFNEYRKLRHQFELKIMSNLCGQ